MPGNINPIVNELEVNLGFTVTIEVQGVGMARFQALVKLDQTCHKARCENTSIGVLHFDLMSSR
jgi:hypothetical protein